MDFTPGSFEDADVLNGRGNGTTYHKGNQRFRQSVQKNKTRFFESVGDFGRRKIQREILEEVHNNGGRFLKQNKGTGYWEELGEREALRKIGQALRDLKKSSCNGDASSGKANDIPLLPPPSDPLRQVSDNTIFQIMNDMQSSQRPQTQVFLPPSSTADDDLNRRLSNDTKKMFEILDQHNWEPEFDHAIPNALTNQQTQGRNSFDNFTQNQTNSSVPIITPPSSIHSTDASTVASQISSAPMERPSLYTTRQTTDMSLDVGALEQYCKRLSEMSIEIDFDVDK